MRQPATLTIVAEISNGKEEGLREYLKKSADMKPTGNTGSIDFKKLGELHFCAMFIIDADEMLALPAALVFEVTIDGDQREFLENMLDIAPEAFDSILSCCEGYPASSMKLKRLVVDYLMLRRVKHTAHHCGYPGRTVSQIKNEQKLRTSLVSHLNSLNDKSAPVQATAADIHRSMKMWLRTSKNLNWCVQKASMPGVIKYRNLYLNILILIVVGLPTFAATIWAWRYLTISPVGVWQLVRECGIAIPVFDSLDNLPVAFGVCGETGSATAYLTTSLLRLFVITGLISVIADWLNGRIHKHRETVPKSFYNEAAFLATKFLALLMRGLAILTGFLAAYKLLDQSGIFALQPWYWIFFAISLALVLFISRGIFSYPLSWLNSRVTKLGFLNSIFYFFLSSAHQLIHFSLQLVFLTIGLAGVSSIIWILRILGDEFHIFMLKLFGSNNAQPLYAPVSEFIGAIPEFISMIAKELVYISLAALPFVIAGVFLLALVLVCLFVVSNILNWREHKRHQNCETLVARDFSAFANANATAREEHGYNTTQNHLVSVVHVKSGFFRLAILRFVFWAIEILAIYLFNLGVLASIPTILSARWILINNGKRLVFMTNYVGAWDSYINEFLDLEGVRGVNAVWSNTTIRDPDNLMAKNKMINFPQNSFLLWEGAEKERQFKSFIRASQVETLVWYGAYPHLSVSNINNNTKLRNRLFDNLSTSQINTLTKLL